MSITGTEDVENRLMLQLMREAKETISAGDFRKEIEKWK
jgi:hypothetical protein